MSMTDPIADMLVRIRNASRAEHEKVDIPASKLKTRIAGILKDEGFIKNYRLIEDAKQGTLRIYLKYGAGNEKMISGLVRVSTPGLLLTIWGPKNDVTGTAAGSAAATSAAAPATVRNRHGNA